MNEISERLKRLKRLKGLEELTGTIRSDENLDINNITGKKLAEIGKAVLQGGFLPQKQSSRPARSDVIDYESLKWLDDRINEVCNKGRI